MEYDANRIAAAYWLEIDPALMTSLDKGFWHILDGAPNPVPLGQSVDTYFNENYDKLGLTPDYTWFQAKMVTSVGKENPPPTFAQTLAHLIIDCRWQHCL